MSGEERKSQIARATWMAALTSAGVIAFQVAGKAVRDTVFLSHFPARALPQAMAVGAVLSLFAAYGLSKMLSRFSPSRVMPVLFVVSAAGLALNWFLDSVSASASAIGVYIHLTVFSPVLLTGFWSVINEHFDPYAAKGAVARIGAGGTWGGVIGGVGAWRAAKVVSEINALLFLAAINLICAVGIAAIRSPKRTRDGSDEQISPISALRGAPLLRNLTLLVLLGAIASSLLDYVFSVQASAAFRGQELLSFLAFFGLCVSLTSLLVQTAVGKAALEKAGLAINIGVLPGIILFGGSFGLAVPGLLSASLLRGAEMVQRNSLFRSAYELLYTPLAESKKRATKVLIDVGVDRFGTVLGSGVVSLVLYLSASQQRQQSYLLAACVFLAIATFPVIRGLHQGYVGSLEQGLRDGVDRADLMRAAEPAASYVSDMKERTRERVIERLERIRHPDDATGPARNILARPKHLAQAASDILSLDTHRARRSLANWGEEHRWLAGMAILLLAHPTLHVDARAALRRIAKLVTGQLSDALLDSSLDFAIRRRLPAILCEAKSQSAADGLVAGLSDARFHVRFACGRALLRMCSVASVEIPAARIFKEVENEAAQTDPAELELVDEDADADDNIPVFARLVAVERVGRRIEHLFTLLALVVEREPIRLCFEALQADDERRRGTALEYLEATLPAELRAPVMTLVSPDRPVPNPREAAEVLQELLKVDARPSGSSLPTMTTQTPGEPPRT